MPIFLVKFIQFEGFSKYFVKCLSIFTDHLPFLKYFNAWIKLCLLNVSWVQDRLMSQVFLFGLARDGRYGSYALLELEDAKVRTG